MGFYYLAMKMKAMKNNPIWKLHPFAGNGLRYRDDEGGHFN